MKKNIQDKYNIKNKIGNGNFSVVYIATNKSDPNQLVAIKVMNTHLNIGIKQANLLKKLCHPNIIQIHDFQKSQTQNQLKIVMEYIPQNILQLYQSHKFGLRQQQVKCILFQCALGLSHIHQKGVIHRDIKPQNLLIDKKKAQIKIIDFGLAAFTYKISTDYVATRWYRAPQNLLSTKQYTTAIDIFSLGCVIVQLYLGDPLFPGLNNIDQLYKIFNILGQPTQQSWPKGFQMYVKLGLKSKYQRQSKITLKKLLESCNQGLIDIIQKMLILNPSKRLTANDILKHKYFQDIITIIPSQVYQRYQSDILLKNHLEKRERFRFLSQQKKSNFLTKNQPQKTHIKSQKNILVGQKIEHLKNRIQTVIQNLNLSQRNLIHQKKVDLKQTYQKGQNQLQSSRSLKALPKPKDEIIKFIQKMDKQDLTKSSSQTLKSSIEKYQFNIQKLNQKMESLKFGQDSIMLKSIKQKSNRIQTELKYQQQKKIDTNSRQNFNQKNQENDTKKSGFVPIETLSFRGLNHHLKKNKISIKQLGKKIQMKLHTDQQNSKKSRSQSQSSSYLQKIIRTNKIESNNFFNNSKNESQIVQKNYKNPNKILEYFQQNQEKASHIANKQQTQNLISNQDKAKQYNQKINQNNNFAKAKVSKNYMQVKPKIEIRSNNDNLIKNQSTNNVYPSPLQASLNSVNSIQSKTDRSISIQRKIIYQYNPIMTGVHQNNNLLTNTIAKTHQRTFLNDSLRRHSLSNEKHQINSFQQIKVSNLVQPSRIYRQNKSVSHAQGNISRINIPTLTKTYEQQNQKQQSLVYNPSLNMQGKRISGLVQSYQLPSLKYQKNYDVSNHNIHAPSNISNSMNLSQQNRSIQNKLKLVASRDFQRQQIQRKPEIQRIPLASSMPLDYRNSTAQLRIQDQIRQKQQREKQNMFDSSNVKYQQGNQKDFQQMNNFRKRQVNIPISQQKLIYSNNKISLKSSGLSKIRSLANLSNHQQHNQSHNYVQINQKTENKMHIPIYSLNRDRNESSQSKNTQKIQIKSNRSNNSINAYSLPINNAYPINKNYTEINTLPNKKTQQNKFSDIRTSNEAQEKVNNYKISNETSIHHNLPPYNNQNFQNNFKENHEFNNIPITHSTKSSFKQVVHREFYAKKPLPVYNHNTRFSYDGNQKSNPNLIAYNKIESIDHNNKANLNSNSIKQSAFVHDNNQDPKGYRSSFSLNDLRQSIKNFIPEIIYMQIQQKGQKDSHKLNNDCNEKESNTNIKNEEKSSQFQKFDEKRSFMINDSLSNNKSEKNININLNLKIYNNKRQ